MEIEVTKVVVLFDDSSAKNFSLYQMFNNKEICSISMPKDIKFYCRCEDGGIQSIIEDYHDRPIKNKTGLRKDLELISIPELRVRQLLTNNPLHQYYLKDNNTNITLDEVKKWDLHLLIVGFGKIGQQMLLQAMNQGIVSSENKILIDIVDFDIDKKKSIFDNVFHDEYVDVSENEIRIPESKANGGLQIRFHKMDIRFKQFQKILQKYGNPSSEDGIYTYIAICVKDTDISLHCMTQVQQYLKKYGKEEQTSIAIRMEYDRQMACYLNDDDDTYKNVFAIEDTESTITLKDLLHCEIDQKAKEFNRIYNESSLLTDDKYDKREEPKNLQSGLKPNANEVWRGLELVRRNSNRALAFHQEIKEMILREVDLIPFFGPEGSILTDKGDAWTYASDVEVAQKQSDEKKYPLIAEFSKMEHRRWCYYMASCGWKRTDDPKGQKNDALKENPCLCNWTDLVENKPDTCVYDLMPLILYYENQKNKKLEAK